MPSSASQPQSTVALAELKTPEGTFLIQERRAVPRDPAAGGQRPARPGPAQQSQSSTSAPMVALGGLIIIGVLIGSYTTKYDLAIGHANGALAFPAVGFLALQLFLARAAYRLFHDVRQFETIGAYAQHRILRYTPAVIPTVILGFLVACLSGLTCFPTSFSSLPANLAMVADMVGVPDIDSSHWRLKIEILLSVLIALSWFSPLRRHLAAMLLVGLGLSALYLDGEPARQSVLTLHGLMTADGYFPHFAFGIALYQIAQNATTQDRLAHDGARRLWWFVGAASAVLVFLSNTPWHGAFVLASLAVLAVIVAGRLTILGRARWLVMLGELAFPIYVAHYVVGFALIHALESRGVPPVMAILVASGVAIALGKVVNMVFEAPAVTHGPAVLEAMMKAIVLRPAGAPAFAASAAGAAHTPMRQERHAATIFSGD